jgi:hypothetical protein
MAVTIYRHNNIDEIGINLELQVEQNSQNSFQKPNFMNSFYHSNFTYTDSQVTNK